MTTIHLTMVAHSLAKEVVDLWESIRDPRIFLHLFLHSSKPDVQAMCEELSWDRNVFYYPYGENRGLARSWNEGMAASRKKGADVVMIANDDIRAEYDDLWKIARHAQEYSEAYMVSGMGMDLTTGEHKDMLMALCAFNPVAFERLSLNGKLFDEQFEPIYYEDLDLYRRADLLGLKQLCVADTRIQHIGSATRKVNADESQFMANFNRNQMLYIKKWGGDGTRGSEVFTTPYNIQVNHP